MLIADPQTPQERDALWAAIEADDPVDTGMLVETVFVDCLDVPELGELSLDECTDLIATVEQLRARADGVQQQILVQVAEALEDRDRVRHGSTVAEKQYYVDQTACLLRVSPFTACERIAQARALVRHFPDVLALVKAGTVSLLQARMVYVAAESTIDRLTSIGADVDAFTGQLQAAILPRLSELTCGEVRTATAKLAARLAPQTGEQAHNSAYAERKVTAKPLPDGWGCCRCTPARTRSPRSSPASPPAPRTPTQAMSARSTNAVPTNSTPGPSPPSTPRARRTPAPAPPMRVNRSRPKQTRPAQLGQRLRPARRTRPARPVLPARLAPRGRVRGVGCRCG